MKTFSDAAADHSQNFQTVWDFKPSIDPQDIRLGPARQLIQSINEQAILTHGHSFALEEFLEQKEVTQAYEAAERFANVTPEDGRYKEKIAELAPYLSEAALVRARIIVEALWLRFQIKEVLPEGTVSFTEEEFQKLIVFADDMPFQFTLRVGQIEAERKHDVIGMIEALREKFADILTPEKQGFIHLGLTSEDVNDLSQKILFKNTLNKVFHPKARQLVDQFNQTAERLDPLADPLNANFTLGARYRNYADRIAKHLNGVFDPSYLTVKFSGATGTHAAMGIIKKTDISGQQIARDFTAQVAPDLQYLPVTAQINPHDDYVIWCAQSYAMLAEIESICAEIWLDSGKDIWIDGKPERMLLVKASAGAAGSSAMPQKVQVIDIENARATCQLLQGSLQAQMNNLSHNRLQRELSDSRKIREMMGDALPKILHLLGNIQTDLKKLTPHDKAITLNQNLLKIHPENPVETKDDSTIVEEIDRLYKELGWASLENSDTPLLAKTHNQPASPTTFGKELRVFGERLKYLSGCFVEDKINAEILRFGTNKVCQNLLSDLEIYRHRGLVEYETFADLMPVNAATTAIKTLHVDTGKFRKELEFHFESLGEAVQTILRRYQVPNAYNIVKKVTQGAQMNQADYQKMIDQILAMSEVSQLLPIEAQRYLRGLTPAGFTGEASKLARLKLA